MSGPRPTPCTAATTCTRRPWRTSHCRTRSCPSSTCSSSCWTPSTSRKSPWELAANVQRMKVRKYRVTPPGGVQIGARQLHLLSRNYIGHVPRSEAFFKGILRNFEILIYELKILLVLVVSYANMFYILCSEKHT